MTTRSYCMVIFPFVKNVNQLPFVFFALALFAFAPILSLFFNIFIDILNTTVDILDKNLDKQLSCCIILTNL
jgi:hypothetical protein